METLIKALAIYGAINLLLAIIITLAFVITWYKIEVIDHVDSEQQQVNEKDIVELSELQYSDFFD